MSTKPWGNMDPNSENQIWSRWTFEIWENGKHPSLAEVQENALRWLRSGFGTVGHACIEEKVRSWRIIAEVEGAPAHDLSYVHSVRQQFQKNFVEKGWGTLGVGSVDVELLAGDDQSGRPRSQLIVMPMIQPDVDFIG